MPSFTADQIYAFARQAGFSPDQSATMTAIALAESGGDSQSHNTAGEDSRGLWQINVDAHPDFPERYSNLYDPAQNARAAFEVSRHGADVSPWTTTHGNMSARYLRFREQAEHAAVVYGDGPNHGVWTGTLGYGHPFAAGRPDGFTPATTTAAGGHDGSDTVVVTHNTPPPVAPGGPTGGHHHRIGADYGIPADDTHSHPGEEYGIPADDSPDGTDDGTPHLVTTGDPNAGGVKLHQFLDAALAQTGDRYVFGAEANLHDPNPSAFDCSELVQWAAAQAGVTVEDGVYAQFHQMQHAGTLIPVQDGIHTPGAVLINFTADPNGPVVPTAAHIAISLGNGQTIEARGSRYGVGSWPAQGRFQYAAIIPGISDHVGPVPGYVPHIPHDPNHPFADDPALAPHAVALPAPGGPAPDVHLAADPTDEFAWRLEVDPDPLDTQPGAVADSLVLAGEAPPPPAVPEVPDPAHDFHQPAPSLEGVGDIDGDGFDDSLAQTLAWSPHPPGETLPLPDNHHDLGPDAHDVHVAH